MSEYQAFDESNNDGNNTAPPPPPLPQRQPFANNNNNTDNPRNVSTTTSIGTSSAMMMSTMSTIDGLRALDIDMEDALELVGMGMFQYQILLAAGLCFAADAMEVLLLSFLSTIIQMEWQLVGHQMDTIISIVFAGAMMGTLVLNPLGDMYGRKPIFIVTAAIITLFGFATAFCSSYHTLLITRFMVGFGVGGLVIPFDTLAEFVPTSHRGANLLNIEFFWTAGTLLVPLIAWATLGGGGNNNDEEEDGSWRVFVILCALPCLLSTALGILLVPESPRWLLTQGKNQQALLIMRQAAARNGHDPYHIFPEGSRLVTREIIHKNQDFGGSSFRELLSPQWLSTSIKLWSAWFGLAFLYYGVIIAVSIVFTTHEQDNNNNNDNNDDGDSVLVYDFDYSAILISASSEIFGLVIVLVAIDKWGRIPTQTTAYLLGGITCLLLGLAAAANAPRSTLIILAFLSRMAMMGSSCTTWVSTSEILSTEIRATGHGVANAMARLGGFFCPYIISEQTPIQYVGVFIFVVSVATASVSWFLPETKGQAMGDGIERQQKRKDPRQVAQDSTRFEPISGGLQWSLMKLPPLQ